MSLPKPIRKFQAGIAYYALLSFEWLIVHIPLPIILPFMDGLLNIGYLFMKRLKTLAIYNLHIVYGNKKGEKELLAMTKACLKNIGHSMIEMIYFVNRPKKYASMYTIEGIEHIEKAYQQNKGIIGVTAHLGNFPLMFVALVQSGYKVNAIIRPMRDKGFSHFMDRQTKKWGIDLISTKPKKEFLKKTLSALKNNEFLFILLDEDNKDKDGVEVEFFGKKTLLSKGAFLFQNRCQSAILPMFVSNQPDGRQKIVVHPPLNYDNASSENIQQKANQLTQLMEEMILAHPVEWGGWLNKRWKRMAES